jgi:hypothetical protein
MAIYRGSGGSVEGITESDVVTIAISQGGTGANTAAGARANLGLGTAATTDASAYATAAQGTLADSAVQPGDIGTAAAEDVGYFATAAQGSLADSALQSDDIGVSIQAYDAQLADVAGLTATDNGVIIGNGTNFVVESGATLRTSLGLAIGTDVLAPNGSAASLTSFPTLNQNTTGTAANVSGVVAIANGGTGQTTATTARAALLPTYATNAGKVLAVKADASDVEYIAVGGSGTVSSVDMSVPTGLAVSGNPVTTTGTLAVTYASGYAIPTTAKQTEWDTAYTDRIKWDGGATGLTAATGRTSLGLGTAATTAATDYATAAQGTNADTAYGWGNHASAGYAADSAVVHDTGDETIAGVKTFSSEISAPNTFGFKNRIINGAMMIDQRNAGASVTPINAQFLVDRWQAIQTASSKYSAQQNAGSVTPPVGFSNYLGITSLSAYAVTSSDSFNIRQAIEGFNCADLAWGTASAATVTLSFWVRSSLTGTFGGSLRNNAADRSYPFSYAINAANTWEQKSITISGDTSGTWLTNNGVGILLGFGLGVGSTISGTAGAWAAGSFVSATGATSVVGTSGATFYITGVQLEKGSTATSFDFRPYGTELSLCQRYYWKCTASLGSAFSTSGAGGGGVRMPVTMRAQPTVDSGATFSISSGSAGTVATYTGTGGGSGGDALNVYNSGSNWTTGSAVSLNAGFNAEL